MAAARVGIALSTGIAVLALVAGCSSRSDDIAGNWQDQDGHTATIGTDGRCTGMYYNGAKPLDIGGPESCSYSDGTLVVTQSPNEITYRVEIDGDTMTLTSGSTSVELTRLKQ